MQYVATCLNIAEHATLSLNTGNDRPNLYDLIYEVSCTKPWNENIMLKSLQHFIYTSRTKHVCYYIFHNYDNPCCYPWHQVKLFILLYGIVYRRLTQCFVYWIIKNFQYIFLTFFCTSLKVRYSEIGTNLSSHLATISVWPIWLLYYRTICTRNSRGPTRWAVIWKLLWYQYIIMITVQEAGE